MGLLLFSENPLSSGVAPIYLKDNYASFAFQFIGAEESTNNPLDFYLLSSMGEENLCQTMSSVPLFSFCHLNRRFFYRTDTEGRKRAQQHILLVKQFH